MAKVDLHIHSNYSSDGDFTPSELIGLSLAAGLTHIAIADHNSVNALAGALQAASGTLLCVIPAIEMDCTFDGVNLHLLGYGIDYSAAIFTEIQQALHQQEQDNSQRVMELVRQLGIDFEDEVIADLAYDGVVTGEMIAEAALLNDPQAENPLLDPYRAGGQRSDNPLANFYWDYCAQGKPAYTPMEFPSLSRVMEIIRENHGVPILAHPGLQVKEDASLLARIIAAGVAGLEVYSSYHTREQIHFYRQAVESKHILMTCGSDFHGRTKQNIKIGDIDAEGQDEHIITALIGAIQRA